MAGRNIDLEDCFSQDDYYSDPEQPNPEGRPCLPGEGAEALIIEAFGSREAAEEYVRTAEDDDQIDEEVLDLLQARADYIKQHPEEAIPWEDFVVELDKMFDPPKA